jgi:hypothetical protein
MTVLCRRRVHQNRDGYAGILLHESSSSCISPADVMGLIIFLNIAR